MANLTLKKIGDDIRGRLKAAQADHALPHRGHDSYDYVRYEVRVSNAKGAPKVNITISGYEWLIPDPGPGDLKRWGDTEGSALIEQVDRIAARERFASADGAVKLGGETKFGPYITVTVTAVRHETNATAG